MASIPDRGPMALTAFLLASGYDERAWRLPECPSSELGTLGPLLKVASAYEAAKIDALFIADTISAVPLVEGDLRFGSPYEPLTALAALSSVTSRIGLIGTFSTTFNHPFNVARRVGALDVLSGGRAGWNAVTSMMAAENFGIEMPTKEERYDRAAEFISVVCELWKAWDDEAVIDDKVNGRWVSPEMVHPISHAGQHFRVEGFTNQRRSPQGHPVIVQAGQSSGGRDLGARVAEVVYTAQPHFGQAVNYYEMYKGGMAPLGRDPESLKILPGLVPFIGDTREEAEELRRSLDQFTDFHAARAAFTSEYGVDLSDVDLDERIPEERFAGKDDDSAGTRFMAYRHLAVEERYTLRQLLTAGNIRGHLEIVGTADDVADEMIRWYDNNACDGFSLNAPVVPVSVDQITKNLIPLLQERGYAKDEYRGGTLRENLGLAFPS